MLKFIPFIILLLFATALHAQDKRNRIDSLQTALKTAKDKDKPELYNELATEYRHISGDTTLIYAKKTIKHATANKDPRIEAEGYLNMAYTLKDRGEYQQAVAYQLMAVKIIDLLGDEKGLAAAYNGIGISYKKMRRWNEALIYYKKANNLAEKLKDYARLSFTYNNIGTIYLEKEDWVAVKNNYDSALKYAELAADKRALATVLSNMADLYRAQHKYTLATSTLKRCLEYDKANEDKYGMYMSYFQIARIYSEQKDYQQWERYADSADKIAIDEQLNRERIDLLSWRATVAEWRGEMSAAYRYYRAARTINDSLLNEATSKQISELQTKYETEKKEQQIALQQSALDRKNLVIGGISGILGLGILLSYSYYRRYRLTQQARLQKAVMQQQELATQAVIEAEENERKRIAGDLHDGVGQLMSAARMNLSVVGRELKFDDENQKHAFDKALSLVDDSCKEVRAVSHNIMPNALLKTGLASAIREFLQKIDHRALEVNLYTEGISERLPSNIEIVLYRVVQECVNNVIKHSSANKLDITLIKDDEGISITIEDNGKGFDPQTQQGGEGIGLKNMQTRIHYLKGNIEWDSAPGKGTVVTIHVPEAEVI